MRKRGTYQVVAALCVGAILSLHVPAAWAQATQPTSQPAPSSQPQAEPPAPTAKPVLPSLKAVVPDDSNLVALPRPPSPYRLWAWVGTGLSVAFAASALSLYFLTKGKSGEMEDYVRDNSCGPDCNGQPSLAFDDAARAIEADGKLYSGLANIFFGLTIITMGTTGILWGLDYKYNDQQEMAPTQAKRPKAKRLSFTPWISGENAGLSGRLSF